MFWEFYQSSRISRVGRAAKRASLRADQTLAQTQRLEDKVDGLALACQALWELQRDNSGLTEQQLEEKMEEVDMRDGRLDGMLSSVVDKCAKCGRKTSRRRPRCLYCGSEVEKSEVFGER